MNFVIGKLTQIYLFHLKKWTLNSLKLWEIGLIFISKVVLTWKKRFFSSVPLWQIYSCPFLNQTQPQLCTSHPTDFWWANPRWSEWDQHGETSASSWGSLMLPLPLERGASVPQIPLPGWKPGMPQWLGKEPPWSPAGVPVHPGVWKLLEWWPQYSCSFLQSNLQSTDTHKFETLISKENNFSIYVLKHASTSREKANSSTLHCLESLHNSPPTVCCLSIFILNSIYTGIYFIYTNTFSSCWAINL